MVDKVSTIYDTMLAVRTAMQNDIRTKDYNILLMSPVNRNAETAANGWLGLYVDSAQYRPRTVGSGMGNWGSNTVVRMIAQYSDMESAEKAFENLSTLVKNAVDVLLANPTIQGAAENMPSIDVNYASRDTDHTTYYFQAALVTISFISRSY